MPRACWMRWLGVVALPLLAGQVALPQASKGVNVQVVHYGDLVELVQKHRGKVVVVDFWATFCPPCVAELPNVVHMHNKYAAQGLVTISVSLDQVKSHPSLKQKVLQQLQKVDARLANFILDEEFAAMQQKLRFEGPPCVFVFNRHGKWVEFKEERFRHDLIEQTVIQFLKGP